VDRRPRGAQLSLEHALLPLTGAGGYEPEPWTPADSVAWLKAMAWDLRSNLETELERGRLQGVDLGEGRDWQDLFPAFPYDRHPTILPAAAGADDGSFDPEDGAGRPGDAPRGVAVGRRRPVPRSSLDPEAYASRRTTRCWPHRSCSATASGTGSGRTPG
jgi:hypothetical protein